MRENNRNPIEKCRKKLPQFTTMNVIDGQAGLVIYSSLIFYSLTIDNILNIVILIILATVAISYVFGENGLMKYASTAKERGEIDSEKEKISLSVLEVRGKNNGKINETKLQEALDVNIGEGKTEVEYEEVEEEYFIKFKTSERIYKVDKNGEVTYLGEENELIEQIEIIAKPENNTEAQLVQTIEVEINIPMKLKDTENQIVYAWNKDKEKEPEEGEFVESIEANGRKIQTQISSSQTEGGEYYLWIKVVIGEKEKTVY